MLPRVFCQCQNISTHNSICNPKWTHIKLCAKLLAPFVSFPFGCLEPGSFLAVEEVALAVMLWLADAMQSWRHGWRCKAARACAITAHAS